MPVTERTEIERLDLVARAEAIKASFVRSAIVFTFLSGFGILLAISSEASYHETLAVRALASLAVVTTIMLWLRSRYSLYAMEMIFFGTLSAGLLVFDDPDNHTLLGASAQFVGVGMLLWGGYRCWANAKPFAEAHGTGFETERSQVRHWMHVLDSQEHSDYTVDFTAKSFRTGYWTYRLLHTGSCWLIEKFKLGRLSRLLDCRVRALGAVRVVNQSEGKLSILLGDQLVSDVHMTPDMLDRLSRLTSS
jgi:hypothetical protein